MNIYLKVEPSKETFYFFGDKNMVYKPKENRWDAVGWEINYIGTAICVIDSAVRRFSEARGEFKNIFYMIYNTQKF